MSATPPESITSIGIYTQMIAGSFPRGATIDAGRTVTLIAQDLLSTERVHMLTAIADDRVYYFAVASRELASSPVFLCPLAVALPNHPDHQGDGAYLHRMSPHAAVVLRRGTEMRYLVGFADEVAQAIEAAALPTIDVAPYPGRQLHSRSWIYRSLTNRAAQLTSTVSLVALLLSGIVYLASHAVSGYLSAGQATQAQALATQANAAIESAQLSHPLGRQINRISTLSAAVVKTGGWIDGYQFSSTTGERFTLSLPGWVTGDVIKELGDGVRTELQGADNLVWAVKADATGKSIQGIGPAQLSVKAGDGK